MSSEADRMLQAAEIMAASMQLFAAVSGMNAANDQRKAVGASMAYEDRDFAIDADRHEARVKEILQR